MFKLIRNEKGSARLIDSETGKQFGEIFQESLRDERYKACFVVFQKYRRKLNLHREDFNKLLDYILKFYDNRIELGKTTNKDFLIQEASAEIKRWTLIK